MKRKLWLATQLFRWNLSMGIIGTVFTVLTFVGVYFVVLGPALMAIGVPSWSVGVILALLTLVIVLGFGLYLDRTARFWTAQATIGTSRNQYLVDTLYNKELVKSKVVDLPMQRGILYLLKKSGAPQELIDDLEIGIDRSTKAIKTHRWELQEDERVY